MLFFFAEQRGIEGRNSVKKRQGMKGTRDYESMIPYCDKKSENTWGIFEPAIYSGPDHTYTHIRTHI